MRNPYLIGEMVYLRPFDLPDDCKVATPWFNDAEVTRYLRRYLPMTEAEQEEYLRKMRGSATDIVLAIVERASDRLVGACGMHEIHPRNRNAWLGITIGEKTCWGKGYGTEAMALLIRLAFATLNLHRVFLHVYAFNARAVKVYERLGFRLEGRLRQDVFVDGEYHDTLAMGLLRDEWLALLPDKV